MSIARNHRLDTLSSAEASLYRRETGKKGKNKRAGHDGKGKERKGRRLPPFLSSHRPPRTFYFSIIAVPFSIFIGIQPENLRRRENSIWIRDLPITGVSIQLNYAARERLEDTKKIKPIYKDNALAFIFQEDCGTILTSTNYFCYKDLTISKSFRMFQK